MVKTDALSAPTPCVAGTKDKAACHTHCWAEPQGTGHGRLWRGPHSHASPCSSHDHEAIPPTAIPFAHSATHSTGRCWGSWSTHASAENGGGTRYWGERGGLFPPGQKRLSPEHVGGRGWGTASGAWRRLAESSFWSQKRRRAGPCTMTVPQSALLIRSRFCSSDPENQECVSVMSAGRWGRHSSTTAPVGIGQAARPAHALEPCPQSTPGPM